MLVTVLGLGKVGLPTACYFASIGHTVRGFDIDQQLMQELQGGINPMIWEPEIDLSSVEFPTTLANAVSGADCVYIIVPTPVVSDRLSSSLIFRVLTDLDPVYRTGVKIIASTLDPRDADTLCASSSIAYNPPLIRLGDVISDLRNATVGLVGCVSSHALESVLNLWQWERTGTKVITGSPKSIALAKLAINVSLSSRVAWANEIATVCHQYGGDVDVVLGAVRADPRIGSGYLNEGWPPSGPCLPRDMYIWTSLGDAPMASEALSCHVRERQKYIDKVVNEILSLVPLPKVAILGITYNSGALDITHSHGIELAKALQAKGVKLKVYDPAQAMFSLNIPTASTMKEAMEEADIVVITTPWDEFNNIDSKGKFIMNLTIGKR